MGAYVGEYRAPTVGVEVEPTLALWGIGALMLGIFLLGMKTEPKRRAYKKRRSQKRIQKLRKELRELTGQWPQLSD